MKLKKILFAILVFAVSGNSCRTTKSSTFGYKKTEAKDTITDLQQPGSGKIVVLQLGNGKFYYAKNVLDSSIVSPPLMLAAGASSTEGAINEKFRNGESGGVREEAKTTFNKGTYKKMSLKNLFKSFPNANDMDKYNLGNNSARVTPELKNVFITKAYLYIVKHEDDNDYHFIFGDKPNYQDATYILNGEISGLPITYTKNADRLKTVRQKAIAFFNTIKQCGTSNYILSIPIQIKGSLFYDFFHRTSTAKCLLVQSKTPWEIHPVYDIIFN